MPKKAFFESAKHHILLAAKDIASNQRLYDPHIYGIWRLWVNSFEFIYLDSDTLKITWQLPKKGSYKVSIKGVKYYTRGDTIDSRNIQKKNHQIFSKDKVLTYNVKLFHTIVFALAKKAKIPLLSKHKKTNALDIAKIHDEEELSDIWAKTVDPSRINVTHTNTALTSPELRFIHKTIGNIRGKKIADLGCGLGEVSVYFAIKGAQVTAVDLSQEMLGVTQAVAEYNKVKVQTIHASVEELSELKLHTYDYVYVGNVFHHVDIPKTLRHITRILKPGGTLVCWEPVGYNPIINVYRKLAYKVRSHEERPFKEADLVLFKNTFPELQIRWFWLTTMVIFIIMAIVERRNPNKERFWKTVITESEKWKPVYAPLEKLDRLLLGLFPKLGYLCWNVVLVCRKN